MCYRYQLSRKYRQKIEKFISNFANEMSMEKTISAKLVILIFLYLCFILNITLVNFHTYSLLVLTLPLNIVETA